MTGLIAFVVGWLAAGVIGWPYIKAGFDTGNPAAGVGRFIFVVFGVAIASGLAGMLLGWLGGKVWEYVHRGRRARAQRSRSAAMSALASVAGGPSTVSSERDSTGTSRAPARAAVPALRFGGPALDVDAYLALVERVDGNSGAPSPDRARIAAALERTVNVSAWDGERLVGVARMLTDGYAYAALADLFVDPAFQRRGIGRELLNRAFERTPRGVLLIGAPLSSSGFFDRTGCDRGPTGFTMRRAARALAAS